ncbi:MAG: hypothetical protein HY075_00555 [Deltaproteobacteria bacterium]|nr:hypothetical protein [Deltaproteobacteria bacterium]
MIATAGVALFVMAVAANAADQDAFKVGREQCALHVEDVRAAIEPMQLPADFEKAKGKKACEGLKDAARKFVAFCGDSGPAFTPLSAGGPAKKSFDKVNAACARLDKEKTEFCGFVRAYVACGCGPHDPTCGCLEEPAKLETVGSWGCKDKKDKDYWQYYSNALRDSSASLSRMVEATKRDLDEAKYAVDAPKIADTPDVKHASGAVGNGGHAPASDKYKAKAH